MGITRFGLIAATGLLATACAQLPVDGPNRFVVDREATASLKNERRSVVLPYALVDIGRSVLENVVDVGPESFFRTFGTGKGGTPEFVLGVGDIIAVSIFESSAGGLFVPGEVGARPGNYLTLPAQAIDAKGNITVPFAGQVRAAGRAIPEVQRDVEQRLSARAIEPQVVIALQQQNASEVAVFGDATGAMKAKLKPGGDRVLDIIAQAGIRSPGYEVYVTLQRGPTRATVYLPTLINRPAENIYVKPGDVLYAYKDPQKFVAVGALGNTSQTQGLTGQLSFDAERLSLAEAVAKAGGLLDTRADASQVLVYRAEYRQVLEKMGVDLKGFPPEQKFIPTIYRANYRDPSGFFVAGQFPIRNKDFIYVGNADSIELDKFFGFIRLITGTVAGVSVDALVTRDAWRALGN
jgi:polysaccharide export outer membrane protein